MLTITFHICLTRFQTTQRGTHFPYTPLFRSSPTLRPRLPAWKAPGETSRPSAPTDGRSVEDDRSAFVSRPDRIDRKSTRLNSSHLVISYAVFCLKKKTLILCYVTDMGDNE